MLFHDVFNFRDGFGYGFPQHAAAIFGHDNIILEIIGPIGVKYAITKAKEVEMAK